MCGRFTLLTPTSDVGRFFRTAVPLWLTPRVNIAPTQSVLGIRLSQGNREAALFRWGLVPSWAEDPSCTIITTEASAPVESAHIRRPVILTPNDYDSWLDPEFQDVEQLQSLLRAAVADELQAATVSATMNGLPSDLPTCVDSVAAS